MWGDRKKKSSCILKALKMLADGILRRWIRDMLELFKRKKTILLVFFFDFIVRGVGLKLKEPTCLF